MKTLLKKCVHLVVAASIPVMLMASCESDLMEPEKAPPAKSKLEKGAGVEKGKK